MTVIIETGFTGDDYPLDHPRIGWRVLPGATVDASSAAAQFDADFALAPQTSTAWRPTAIPANWALVRDDAAPTRNVSYVGISGHDLATRRLNVAVQIRQGGVWSNIGVSTLPLTNDPILFLFAPRLVQGVRIRLTDPGGSAPWDTVMPTISNIRAGVVTEFPQRANYPGTPIDDSRQITYRDNDSVAGEFMGRTALRSGLAFSVEVQHLSETWVASEYNAFREFCDVGDGTFWIAPRPSKYPEEVAYARPDSPIEAPRATPNKAISRDVSMTLRGFRRV